MISIHFPRFCLCAPPYGLRWTRNVQLLGPRPQPRREDPEPPQRRPFLHQELRKLPEGLRLRQKEVRRCAPPLLKHSGTMLCFQSNYLFVTTWYSFRVLVIGHVTKKRHISVSLDSNQSTWFEAEHRCLFPLAKDTNHKLKKNQQSELPSYCIIFKSNDTQPYETNFGQVAYFSIWTLTFKISSCNLFPVKIILLWSFCSRLS